MPEGRWRGQGWVVGAVRRPKPCTEGGQSRVKMRTGLLVGASSALVGTRHGGFVKPVSVSIGQPELMLASRLQEEGGPRPLS